MAVIRTGAGAIPPRVPTGTQTASPSFIRRPVAPAVPQPAQTASPSFVRRPVTAPTAPVPQTGFRELDTGLYGQQDVGQVALSAAQQTPLVNQTTPNIQDIERRRYALPQFGDQPSGLGLDGVLNRQQLAEARRLTGISMFVYGKMPSVISTDVASGLPFEPTSKLFQDVMRESFGVTGFDTSDEFLTRLGYVEYAPGQWEIQDPVTITGYGNGSYQGGSTARRTGQGTSAARGSGYSTGGSLVNWRIGF